MGKYIVKNEYMKFISTLLRGIENEYARLYWNSHQEQLISPFDNNGAESYSNDTFSVFGYDWGIEDEEDQVNFKYKGLEISWYKYCGRCMGATCDVEVNAEYLYHMFNDCITSLQNDFGEYHMEE